MAQGVSHRCRLRCGTAAAPVRRCGIARRFQGGGPRRGAPLGGLPAGGARAGTQRSRAQGPRRALLRRCVGVWGWVGVGVGVGWVGGWVGVCVGGGGGGGGGRQAVLLSLPPPPPCRWHICLPCLHAPYSKRTPYAWACSPLQPSLRIRGRPATPCSLAATSLRPCTRRPFWRWQGILLMEARLPGGFRQRLQQGQTGPPPLRTLSLQTAPLAGQVSSASTNLLPGHDADTCCPPAAARLPPATAMAAHRRPPPPLANHSPSDAPPCKRYWRPAQLAVLSAQCGHRCAANAPG